MAEITILGKEDMGAFEQSLRAESMSEETITQYLAHAARITGLLESADEAGVRKYLGETLKDVKPTYRRFNYCVLRRLFRMWKVPWPEDIRAPKVPQSSISRPRFQIEQIEKIIKARSNLDDRARYYLAMSTTYGLRRGELLKSRYEHRDLLRRRVLVMTGKLGIQRWHIIPDAIIKDLSWDFTNPMPLTNARRMSELFHYICIVSGVESKAQDGWHTIRRSLVRCLRRAGVPKDERWAFLRWKQKGDTDDIYAGELEPEDFEGIDQKVLSKHPFLPFYSAAGEIT